MRVVGILNKKITFAIVAIFALVTQPFYLVAQVGAASADITNIKLTPATTAVDMGQEKSFTLEFRNGTNPTALDDPADVELSTTSGTGEFAEGSSTSNPWSHAPTYQTQAAASKTFRYKDSSAGSVTITARASGGGLTNQLTTTASITVNTTPTSPPPVQPVLPVAPQIMPCSSTTTVKSADMSAWNTSETSTDGSGHFDLTEDGLHAWTDVAGHRKSAGYYATNFALADAGNPKIDIAPGFSGVRPSLQLTVDNNGDGNWYGNLVYEPWAYGNGNWWSNKNFGISNGMGYTSFGTLQDFLDARPNTRVIAIGYSLGSGVTGDAVINKITAGCTEYVFEALKNTVTQVDQNNAYGWAGAAEAGSGSSSFVSGPAAPPLGSGSLSINIAGATDSYVFGRSGYENVRLDDIATLSYSTYKSSGDAAAAPALQINIDNDVTDNDTSWKGRLVYEPYLANGGTTPSGTWSTWDTKSGAGWWFSNEALATTSGCTMASPCTFDEVLTAFPNVGFNQSQGTLFFKVGSGWIQGFEGNIDNFTIATSTFNTTYNFEPVTATTPDPEEPGEGGSGGGSSSNGNSTPSSSNSPLVTSTPATTPISNSAAAFSPVFNVDFTGTANNTEGDVLGTATVKDAAKKAAQTNIPGVDKEGKILGLSWAWWLAILAGVAAGLWWLFAVLRRRKQEDQ